MAIKFIKKSKEFKDKTVFLRLDFNEAVANGKLTDDFRLQSVLPTINLLLEQGCRLIIGSHMGRPEGKASKKFSLEPAAKDLAKLLKKDFVATNTSIPAGTEDKVVFFRGDITEFANRETIKNSPESRIIVLENLRFYKGEEDNGVMFGQQLAELAEIFVNDAFAVSHRKAASLVSITKHLPAYGGLLLQKEIIALNRVMNKPKSPFVLMMGGIKIADKAKTLEHLGRKADHILLGGGLANMLLKGHGYEIGKSINEDDAESQKVVKSLIRNFKEKIVLPKDVVVAKSLTRKPIRAVPVYEVQKDDYMFDIGPQTILEFARLLKKAKTIVWNGPLGHFEIKPFHTATMALARVVGGVSQGKCFGVVGGGETVAAVHQAGQGKHVDHVSTGGGAMLEFLAGIELPALKILEK